MDNKPGFTSGDLDNLARSFHEDDGSIDLR